ncbi:signal peptidase II [Nocardia lijiangensis]|uniref:signal peptidase II n=1 Tax=Nocardia lijiangensis TaxID=299618 RepID=UPI0009FD1D93|nr:signal peptidase II [Nocardia lijiangensis]
MSDDRPPEDNPSDPAQQTTQPLRLRTLLIIAAVLFCLDLLTKTIAVANLEPGEPVYLVGDFARFTLVRNPGAAFSMATGMTWLLTLVAAAVVIGVIRIGRTLRSLWWAIGLGMVLGGALGNLIDRLFRAPGPLQGHVVDFVAIGWWPVFNVADSAIVCGAILLVVLTVFGFEPDGTRTGHGAADEEQASTAQAEPPAETETTKDEPKKNEPGGTGEENAA